MGGTRASREGPVGNSLFLSAFCSSFKSCPSPLESNTDPQGGFDSSGPIRAGNSQPF
jgi:hypothetical protein